jgi:hypothetical protein
VQDVRRVLVDDGVYMVNLIDYPPLRFARAEVATVADVFEYVAVLARPAILAGEDGGNLVVVASSRPLPLNAVRSQLVKRAPELGLLAEPGEVASFAGDARVLTDDFAPVDQLLTYSQR